MRNNLIVKGCSLSIYFLLIFPFVTGSLQLQGQSKEDPNPYTISLDVDQVVLDATVRDDDGGFVSGLSKENFQIFEDGRSQEIEYFYHGDVPVTIGVVVDSSRSMRPRRSHVIAAALAFIQASNPEDEIFIINFNNDVVFGLPEDQLFSNSIPQLRQALLRTLVAGQTALYDAMARAFVHLNKGHHDKKALLVVSDGGDNASHVEFRDILTTAKESDASIYTIALYEEGNKDQNPKVLKKLSKVSGGEFFNPLKIEAIGDICRQIAKDIRNRYTLVYRPSNSVHDGKYRTLRVVAKAPHLKKLFVRTREGYLAASPRMSTQAPLAEVQQ